jgi:hypothetical protein
MYTDIYRNGSQVDFFVENLSSGQYSSFGKPASGFSGTSAELILERSETNCTYPPLAYPSTTSFTDANVRVNGTYRTFGGWPHAAYVMKDDNGTELAHPGPFSNSGANITAYWTATGDVDPAPCPT